MAKATVVREISTDELKTAIREFLFPLSQRQYFSPSEINQGLTKPGIHCEPNELNDAVSSLLHEGTLDMIMEFGHTVNEISVRFGLTQGALMADCLQRAHYPGDGCDPIRTGECDGMPGL